PFGAPAVLLCSPRAAVAGGSASDIHSEGRTMIAILLPLALLGIGFLLYLILAGATYALPLFVGLAAGLAGFGAGLSIAVALLVGVIAFALAIAAGRFMALTLHGHGRLGVALAFAIPAALAGYSVGRMIAALTGFA